MPDRPVSKDVTDKSISDERLAELIAWREPAREGSPHADTTLALLELQRLRIELAQAHNKPEKSSK